ncbi:MAG: hypothetical protein WBR18_12790, partial [Anaerolineales bacterium]
ARILLRLPAGCQGYADAQLDDHHHLPRRELPWRPPLSLTVRARARPPDPVGTLGFGFWNDPFSLSLGGGGTARKLPAAPQALWFFYGSAPNDLAFPGCVRGAGWKAASLRSPAIPAWLLAAPALGAYLLSLLPGIRWPLMRAALRQVRAQESSLAVSIEDWHRYHLVWRSQSAEFSVDDTVVLQADDPYPGPLGFVAWIDNQYAIATPKAGLHFGILSTQLEQSLEIDELSIRQLED